MLIKNKLYLYTTNWLNLNHHKCKNNRVTYNIQKVYYIILGPQ